MASGRTHDIINLLFLPGAVYYLNPSSFEGFISGYLIGTFFLSPDNDLYHSKPNKRWGVFRFLWYPYVKIFSHRGISHLPIIGTVTRLTYLISVFLLLFFAVFLLVSYLYPPLKDDFTAQFGTFDLKKMLLNPFTISFILGLFLSEMIHIFTDLVYSTLKRFKIIGRT